MAGVEAAVITLAVLLAVIGVAGEPAAACVHASKAFEQLHNVLLIPI